MSRWVLIWHLNASRLPEALMGDPLTEDVVHHSFDPWHGCADDNFKCTLEFRFAVEFRHKFTRWRIVFLIQEYPLPPPVPSECCGACVCVFILLCLYTLEATAHLNEIKGCSEELIQVSVAFKNLALLPPGWDTCKPSWTIGLGVVCWCQHCLQHSLLIEYYWSCI